MTKDIENRGSPSLLNILVLYLSLIGLGAIGGYAGFYAVFRQRCQQIIQTAEKRHVSSRQELQEKYMKALENQHQCQNPSAATSQGNELLEIKDRLEAHSIMAEKHQDLLKRQEETVIRLEQANRDKNVVEQKLEQMSIALSQAKEGQESRSMERSILSDESLTAQQKLKARIAELERDLSEMRHRESLSSSSNCSEVMAVAEKQVDRMYTHIQDRASKLCRMQ